MAKMPHKNRDTYNIGYKDGLCYIVYDFKTTNTATMLSRSMNFVDYGMSVYIF